MYDQNYQTSPVRSCAADFRRKAREALKDRWWFAIAAGLLAGILSGGASGGGFNFNINVDSSKLDPDMIGSFVQEGAYMDMFRYIFREGLGIAPMLLLIGAGVALCFAIAFRLFVGAQVAVGYSQFNLDLVDHKSDLRIGTLFSAFRSCYWKAMGIRLLVDLIVFAIMAVLLGIPAAVIIGVLSSAESMALLIPAFLLLFGCYIAMTVILFMVSYQYSLCPYILAECPTMGVVDVLRNSRMLMKGNKWRKFCLDMSFIGWILLSVCCTCGFGMVAVAPYTNAASAAFYSEIANRDSAKDVEFPSVNPEDYFTQE